MTIICDFLEIFLPKGGCVNIFCIFAKEITYLNKRINTMEEKRKEQLMPDRRPAHLLIIAQYALRRSWWVELCLGLFSVGLGQLRCI